MPDTASPSRVVEFGPSFFTSDLTQNLDNPLYMKSRTDLFTSWHQMYSKQNGETVNTGETGITVNSELRIEYVYTNDISRASFGGKAVSSLTLCDYLDKQRLDYQKTLTEIQLRYPRHGEMREIYGETFQVDDQKPIDIVITHFPGADSRVQCLGIVSYTERSVRP